jgi:hypothetical protein
LEQLSILNIIVNQDIIKARRNMQHRKRGEIRYAIDGALYCEFTSKGHGRFGQFYKETIKVKNSKTIFDYFFVLSTKIISVHAEILWGSQEEGLEFHLEEIFFKLQ